MWKKLLISLFGSSLMLTPALVFAQVGDVDPNGPTSQCVSLTYPMRYQSRDIKTNGEVSTLQDFLQTKGYLDSEPTGYFGPLTKRAVQKFQSDSGLISEGFVGVLTRAKIAEASGCTTANNGGVVNTVQPTFTASPATGFAPLLVSFSSSFENTAGASYSIDFGDSQATSSDVTTSNCSTVPASSRCSLFSRHAYASPGTYTSKLIKTSPWCPVTGDQIACIALAPKVEVIATATIVVRGASDQFLTITSPNTGTEVWILGENKNITWNTNINKAVNIALLPHPVVCITTPCPSPGPRLIAQNWTDPSPYQWTAGKLNDSSYVSPGRYKIRICTVAVGRERIFCDESDNWFTITSNPVDPSSITVTAPNGGEQWQLGSTHMILWSPYDPISGLNTHPTVQAYLDRLENGTFVEVGKVLPSGKASIHWNGEIDTYGKYPPPGTNYYIRIVNTQTGISDRSDKSFELVAQNFLRADLKINDGNGPIAAISGGNPIQMKASWDSNAESCSIYNNTAPSSADAQINNLPGAGDKIINIYPNFETWNKYITLSCLSKSPEGYVSDSVEVLPTVTSGTSVSINKPNGGERIALNTPYTINLRHSTDITRISLVLYKNDASYRYVIADLPVSQNTTETSYQWTPSTTLDATDLAGPATIYKIYSIAYKTSGGTVTDMSDAPFSIISGSLLVPCTTTGAVKVGDFNRDGMVSLDEVTKMVRFSNGISPTVDELKIGDTNGDGRITLADVQLATNNQLGGSNCVIGPAVTQRPPITVTAPIEGDKWIIDSRQNISWQWLNGKDTKLRIQLQRTSGDKFVKELAPDGIESGIASFAVTPTSEIPEGNYIIEVCDTFFATGTFICGRSASFTIEQPLSAVLLGTMKPEAHKALVGLSIQGAPENKFVASWKLRSECPQGVRIVANNSTSNLCGTQQSFSANSFADVTQNISILEAAAENTTGSAKTISFALEATGKNGKIVSAAPYSVSLAPLVINSVLVPKTEAFVNRATVNLSIKGFPTNTYVTSWRLTITCPAGVIVVKDVVTNLCGTQTITPSTGTDVTRDFAIQTASLMNTTGSAQTVSFSLTAVGPNGIVKESDPYRVALTAPNQSSIQITYPNAAGTVIVPGTNRPVVITWKNFNVDVQRGFNIYLMDATSGARLQQLTFNNPFNAEHFYWYIPGNYAFQGGQYRIMVSSAADSSVQDVSDEPFTIRGPSTPPSTGIPDTVRTTANTIDALRQALANLQQIINSLSR